ncbi:hypothetical protein ACD591_01845 [Rufibacter glacialis]|uniref:Uncharacterized protein n=1 Tax=Rufibacter glacialis TaxID=1259555 RepID=A0A5M8QKX7_9BACT|nr:hypothetical protein [Rufibacter glacialis]KAA6435634.1 hypothetical protein FOE74_06745 [Rufibacter glacialis]GGK65140.1 hypothetical protein GCM10011405_11450 [Rufibacter glacialis]
MKKSAFLFGALLALAACKQDTAAVKDNTEVQLEEAAEEVAPEATEAPAQSPDGPTPAPAEPMSEEPLPGAPSTASTPPSADNPLFNLTLQKGQAGRVKIGMPIEELKQAYGTQKLQEIDHTLEGTTTKAYEVLGERRRPDLRVEQQCNGTACKVSRITVLNPAFKSSAGVGIGSTFGEVKNHFNITRVGTGEGIFVAISEVDKISFVLDMRQIPSTRWGSLKVKDIPATTPVTSIMLY